MFAVGLEAYGCDFLRRQLSQVLPAEGSDFLFRWEGRGGAGANPLK